MTKPKGMGANPLRRPERVEGRSVVSALGDSSGITQVSTGSIVLNPDNPVARIDDVEALAESVREVGVLQPLLLAPAGAFTAAHPEHRDTVDGYEWVVLAGHRRLAAAAEAGLGEVPAVMRQDLSQLGRDDEVLLHENLHRKELTPLEEARGYARMSERSLSQRAIAKHTGISQGQIAKRLSLLKLVPEAQSAVDSGRLAVVEALEWAKEPSDVQTTALELLTEAAGTPQYVPSRILQTAQHQVRLKVRRNEAQAKATELGLTVLEPLAGGRNQARAIADPDEIEAAKERGDLFVEPGRYQDEPELVTTFWPETEPVSDYEQRERAAERTRKQAMKAREECLRSVAASAPSTKEVSDALIQMSLAGGGLGSTVTTRARKLAKEAGIGPAAESDWDWREQLVGRAQSRGHLAWLIYLAWLEDVTRGPHQRWSSLQTDYLQLLRSHGGYVPTEWEQQRLDDIERSNDPEDGETDER